MLEQAVPSTAAEWASGGRALQKVVALDISGTPTRRRFDTSCKSPFSALPPTTRMPGIDLPTRSLDGIRLRFGSKVVAQEVMGDLASGRMVGDELLYADSHAGLRPVRRGRDELAARYAAVRVLARMKRVVFHVDAQKEDEPGARRRGLRARANHTTLLKIHAQALLRATAGHHLTVAFSLGDGAGDFNSARETVLREFASREARALATPSSFEFGAVLGAAALASEPDSFLKSLDFLCIDDRDLRHQAPLSNHADIQGACEAMFSGAVLHALAQAQRRCQEHNKLLSFCGDVARHPLNALALAAIGFRRLSLPPSSIAAVGRLIGSVDLEETRQVLEDAFRRGQPARENLARFVAGTRRTLRLARSP